MVLNVHRNHKAYWKRGYGGGEEGGYAYYTYTVTTRMTPALRLLLAGAAISISFVTTNVLS